MTPEAFRTLIERHRRELRVHCYRMLGSLEDAEDMVQETMLRAWRRFDGFQGRASVRAWLYKIATNVCLDALERRSRRVLPPAVAPPDDPAAAPAPPLTDTAWLQPFPDRLREPVRFEPVDAAADPAAQYDWREAIELAFVAAVQYLPARQRAALLLCDVLGWSAREVAQLLDTTATSVHSARQRARATLSSKLPAGARERGLRRPTAAQASLVDRYLRAWHAADVPALAALLRADARLVMPPTPSWYEGRDSVVSYLARLLGTELGRGLRLAPTAANGQPALAVYAQDGPDYHAFAIQLLAVRAGAIAEITGFADPALFDWFGLPSRIGSADAEALMEQPPAVFLVPDDQFLHDGAVVQEQVGAIAGHGE